MSAANRESDVYEFFTAAQRLGVDVLTRAAWDRNVAGPEGQVFATLAAAAVLAHKQLALPARGKRKARTAKLEIRACPLILQAPPSGSGRGLPPLALWGVWACEPQPPATAPPLRQAVRWIAQLGGFIGRASDGEPGSQTLWRGVQELIPMTEMYRIMKPHIQCPPVPPKKCG